MATVAIFGSAGAVGIEIARTMVLQPDVTRLVLIDINEAKMMSEANDCAMLAEKMRSESVEVVPLAVDLTAAGEIARVIETYKPDVTVQAAIPISWYTLANSVPPDIWKRVNFEARLGPFLPLLLSFPIRFMEGWKAAGSPGRVIQLSFPDVVNPVLAGMGLGPSCGSGNTENLCSTIRMIVADRFGLPTREVEINLIAHHYHSWFMRSASQESDLKDRPFYLKAYCNSDDVTDELFADPNFIPAVRKRYPYQRPRFAATSVVKNTVRMLRGDRVISHVSSPASFPGGINARYGAGVWEIVLPKGLSEADVLNLLAKARHADGIDDIAIDGTVTFTDRGQSAMKELLGYHCPVLRPAEVHEQADILLQCIKTIRK